MSINYIIEVINIKKCIECESEVEETKSDGRCPICFTREMIANGPKPIAWRDLPENEFFNSLQYIVSRRTNLPTELPDIKMSPSRTPTYHDDLFEVDDGAGNLNIFHKMQLIDVEQGAGALNKTRLTAAIDPELQAKAMPGKNSGWTKNCKKPKCPIHQVTVNEYGYCPVCALIYHADRRIIIRLNKNGYTQTVFETNDRIDKDGNFIIKETPDRYEHPRQCEVHSKEDDKDIHVGYLDWEHEWLKPIKEESYLGIVINSVIPIGKVNFDGYTHKKSSGPSILLLDYNVKQIHNNDKSTYHGTQHIPVRRVKPELRACECGCTFSGKDMRRGEKLCPNCGLVKGKVMISQNKTRGGSDDKDYGGD